MKKPLKIILIIVAVILIGSALWLFWPGNKTVTDPDDYGKYNQATRDMLAGFAGILPDSIPENAQDTEYSYEYIESTDRSFVIDLTYTLDEESYYAEKSRLGHMAQESRLIDGRRYYICSTGDLDELFNETVLDGYRYKVEAAVCDDGALRIEYLVSSYVENMRGGEKLEAVLRPIYDDDNSRSSTPGIPPLIKQIIKNQGK